jgi:hypothetical protein
VGARAGAYGDSGIEAAAGDEDRNRCPCRGAERRAACSLDAVRSSTPAGSTNELDEAPRICAEDAIQKARSENVRTCRVIEAAPSP